MNTNLALSKEALVALAIEAFEKGQKSPYVLQLLPLEPQFTLYVIDIMVANLELYKPPMAGSLPIRKK